MSGMTDADIKWFMRHIEPHLKDTDAAVETLLAGVRKCIEKDARLRGDGEQYPEAAEVCGEAYQVVGSLLDDLGVFEHPHAQKALDNLSQHRMVHTDVLPWPSFAALSTQPAPSEQVAASVAVPDWQPIETAPRDGTEILAWDGEDRIVTHWCKFRDGFGDPYEGWIHPNIGELGPSLAMPTHWQTLAAAPVAPERGTD